MSFSVIFEASVCQVNRSLPTRIFVFLILYTARWNGVVTGPALEAFSKHPVVRRTDTPGSVLTVAEFLRHVHRTVAVFVVNRLFAVAGEATINCIHRLMHLWTLLSH